MRMITCKECLLRFGCMDRSREYPCRSFTPQDDKRYQELRSKEIEIGKRGMKARGETNESE